MTLRKFVTPEVVYGRGSRRLAGAYARNIGAQRVLVVSDAGVTRAGWTGEVERSLRAEGLDAAVFDRVTENPRLDDVAAGVEVARRFDCDAIVAVGGGSSIDTAKAIGVVLANGGSIQSYEGVDRVERPIPPLLTIPTTCGSAAEVSQFAVLTDPDRRQKLAVVSKAIVPDVALVDGETVSTLPPAYVGITALDVVVHATEAYVSNAHGPLTDVHALAALALVRDHLPAALATPSDAAARGQLLLASLHAGFAFSNASLGAVHAMAHALGGFSDTPHGEANAMLLERVAAFNYAAAPERYDAVAATLGGHAGGRGFSAFAEAVRRLRAVAGLERRIRDVGVGTGDLDRLTEVALADPCLATNPRRATAADLRAIYGEAL